MGKDMGKDMGKSDLLTRLRGRKEFFLNGASWQMMNQPDSDCQEAADEIERLRAEVVHYRESYLHHHDLIERLQLKLGERSGLESK